MIFDKKEYWKRRNHVNVTRNEEGEITSATPKPLRGQGEYVKSEFITNNSYSPNRAVRRQRIIDRRFTKKGYAFGLRIGSKKYNIIHHLAKIQAEK